ncbi:hypothetical protein FI667_g2565, partial [Globisporangium splendens]
MDANAINALCDTLVDQAIVTRCKQTYMLESLDVYKRATMLLGYFSQLKDYLSEYNNLHAKVLTRRRDIVDRYQHILVHDYQHIYKQLLVPPTGTDWYAQGVAKYRKVRQYSINYYGLKLHAELENDPVRAADMKKLIETIVMLDMYYEIYDDTISNLMAASVKFEQIMGKQFTEFVQL